MEKNIFILDLLEEVKKSDELATIKAKEVSDLTLAELRDYFDENESNNFYYLVNNLIVNDYDSEELSNARDVINGYDNEIRPSLYDPISEVLKQGDEEGNNILIFIIEFAKRFVKFN